MQKPPFNVNMVSERAEMTEAIFLQNLLNVSERIEKMVKDLGIDYIEACVLYCQETGTDIEQFADLIKKNQNIRSKIQIEAEELHCLPKQKRIPV